MSFDFDVHVQQFGLYKLVLYIIIAMYLLSLKGHVCNVVACIFALFSPE